MRSRVKYLGVTITDEGISDSKLVDRIKKSKNVPGVLRRLGVFTKRCASSKIHTPLQIPRAIKMGILPAPNTVDKQGRG